MGVNEACKELSEPFSFKKLSGFAPFFNEPVRLGMQIAFGRVRRKTAPTGPGVKTRPKKGQLNGSGHYFRAISF